MADDGPLKVTIDYHSKALNVFSKRERNAILAEAIRVAGQAWAVKWMPLRFTNYAKTLGYRVTQKYQNFKNKVMADPQPLVSPVFDATFNKRNRKTGEIQTFNREKLIDTKDRAAVTATAAGGNPVATVTVPTGHPVAAIVSQVMKKIPEKEATDLAKIFAETVTAYVQGASINLPASGNKAARSVLTPAAKRSLNVGRKTAVAKSSRLPGFARALWKKTA